MHPVHDQLEVDPRVLPEREHRARLAVAQGGHRVEQVGGAGRAGVDRRPARVVVGVGVADRRHDTPGGHQPDRLHGPGPLRGDGDHPHRPPAGVEEFRDGVREGVREQPGRVCALVLQGQPGPLEVDAGEFTGLHEPGQARDLAREVGGGAGDERGHHRGHAEPPVRGERPARDVGVLGDEGRAPAAVAVHVHVAGDDDAGEVLVRGPRGCARPGGHDPVSGGLHPAGDGCVGVGEEDPVGGEEHHTSSRCQSGRFA